MNPGFTPPSADNPQVAVLLSGGLDSAVLAAVEARKRRAQPIYVSSGLAWEEEEREGLTRLLAHPTYATMAPLAHLTLSVADIYPASHWALSGRAPAFDSPDEDVYLTGRNIVLLTKAAIHCAQHGIPRLAIGPLAHNPFPDATPEFFTAMGRALSLGLAHDLAIETPLAAMDKAAVIRLGVAAGVPLELTLSCMNPAGGLHCGGCSKCRERRDAFREAAIADPTAYASAPPR